MPNKIIYRSQNDTTFFDIDKYVDSINRYQAVSKNEIVEALSARYPNSDLLHVSCLVEVATNLLDDGPAQRYYADHSQWFSSTPNFERLRRITGYLVGSLERWNDGKKAEEKARVKHTVSGYDNDHGQFTLDQKDEIEAAKLDNSISLQI